MKKLILTAVFAMGGMAMVSAQTTSSKAAKTEKKETIVSAKEDSAVKVQEEKQVKETETRAPEDKKIRMIKLKADGPEAKKEAPKKEELTTEEK